MGKRNSRSVLYHELFDFVSFDNASMVIGLNETMGKECCAWPSKCLRETILLRSYTVCDLKSGGPECKSSTLSLN